MYTCPYPILCRTTYLEDYTIHAIAFVVLSIFLNSIFTVGHTNIMVYVYRVHYKEEKIHQEKYIDIFI